MPTCSACRNYVDNVVTVTVEDTRVAGICPACESKLWGDSEYKQAYTEG